MNTQTRTRIKICGLTCLEDALHAAHAGADALGFVFYENSPRCITLATAREILPFLPPFVAKTAVLVNATPELIEEICQTLPIDILQFHGNEDLTDCSRIGQRYAKAWIKAEQVRMNADLRTVASECLAAGAAALLLDSHDPQKYGGTGRAFDWSLIPQQSELPIILAGGLNPGNVAPAVRHARPWAVDASSGVESAPGKKDYGMIDALIHNALNP